MLSFSDTTNLDGHIQEIERIVYSGDYGRVSGNATLLAQWTVLLNAYGLSKVTALMSQFAGRWRVGDWNHGSYDTATINITNGTREYALTTPQDVLFIFSVLIKQDATTSDYTEIQPFDIREREARGFRENITGNSGVPFRYEKAGGYITLDPVPNYSATAGIKYYYQRAPQAFATSDTTQIAPIPSIFSPLVHLYAIDAHATGNTNVTLKQLVGADIARTEEDIKAFLQTRDRSDRDARLKPVQRSSR